MRWRNLFLAIALALMTTGLLYGIASSQEDWCQPTGSGVPILVQVAREMPLTELARVLGFPPMVPGEEYLAKWNGLKPTATVSGYVKACYFWSQVTEKTFVPVTNAAGVVLYNPDTREPYLRVVGETLKWLPLRFENPAITTWTLPATIGEPHDPNQA